MFLESKSQKNIHTQCAPEPGLYLKEESTKEKMWYRQMCGAGLFIIAHTQENDSVIRKVTWLTMSKSSTTA